MKAKCVESKKPYWTEGKNYNAKICLNANASYILINDNDEKDCIWYACRHTQNDFFYIYGTNPKVLFMLIN
ncbi:hypothetical protein [Morganella morganii]|uniref:hypothetical protein n=1 Tax=Morganella morganii TaxID=582 RepID=UPI00228D5336|nr:hypothetical protein [Morganella morganii]HCU0900275.1 hypothetical protein [Morganella morganii]